jgi:hypothetical protein
MKKIYLLFVLASIAFISNSSLHPSGNTGAPGDSFCGNCHTGSGGALNGEVMISGLPATIQPSTTYSITITVTNPALNASRAGFQILALDDSNNNVGTFSNWPTNAELRMQSGRSYLGHKPAQFFNGQNEVTWTADWTSPASGSGNITIYGSSVIANGAGGNSGDRAVLTNVSGTFSGGGNPLTLTVTEDKPTSCFDSSDGWATANPSGGTSPYSYLWDTGETSQQAIFLDSGTHSVTVTDAANNTASEQVLINSPTEIIVTIENQSDALCFGDKSGTASISANGGTPNYTYEWSDGGIGAVRDDLFAGSYTVTVRDQNGCEKDQVITIGQPDVLEAFEIIEDVSCSGGMDGSISITPTGGDQNYSYQWSNGSGNQNLTNIPSGSYELTLTDGNNCSETFEYMVDEPTSIVIDSITAQPASCGGVSDGSLTVAGSGGTGQLNYIWSNGDITPTANNLSTGSHSVTVTDQNNCSTSRELILGALSNASLLLESTTNNNCFGDSIGTASVTISNGTDYNISWSNGDTGPSITNLPADTFTVIATNPSGCNTNELEVIITQPPAISINQIDLTPPSCFGDMDGTISVMGSGGTGELMYIWSNGTMGTTNDKLVAGTYSIEITDENQCSYIENITLDQPLALSLDSSFVIDLLCYDDNTGEINIMVSGGTGNLNYLWNNGDTTQVITNLPSGEYYITTTDEKGCNRIDTFSVFSPDPLTILAQVENESESGLNDGSIVLIISGGTPGYTITWNTGETTDSLNNLAPGNYTVEIIDANGCITNRTYAVSSADCTINATATPSDASCFGYNDGSISVDVTGNIGDYEIIVNPPLPIDSLTAGTYAIEVTDTAGCSFIIEELIVNEPQLLVLSIDSISPSDDTNNGSIQITASGGTLPFTYSWTNSDGDEISHEKDLINVGPGTYLLTIIDANGCMLSSDELVVTFISSTMENIDSDIQIFPNPVSSALHIDYSEALELIELITLEGQIVKSIPTQESNISFDISELNEGLYLLKVTTHNARMTQKIYISRL